MPKICGTLLPLYPPFGSSNSTHRSLALGILSPFLSPPRQAAQEGLRNSEVCFIRSCLNLLVSATFHYSDAFEKNLTGNSPIHLFIHTFI